MNFWLLLKHSFVVHGNLVESEGSLACLVTEWALVSRFLDGFPPLLLYVGCGC